MQFIYLSENPFCLRNNFWIPSKSGFHSLWWTICWTPSLRRDPTANYMEYHSSIHWHRWCSDTNQKRWKIEREQTKRWWWCVHSCGRRDFSLILWWAWVEKFKIHIYIYTWVYNHNLPKIEKSWIDVFIHESIYFPK